MIVKVKIPAIPERHVPFKLPLRYTREDVKRYAAFHYVEGLVNLDGPTS